MLIFATLVTFGAALFTKGESAVEVLSETTFKTKVLESKGDWLVEFYAPWCGHCKKSANDVKQAANILRGISNIGVVDATEEKSLGEKYGVSGYPTLKLFRDGTPSDYSSNERSFDDFVEFLLTRLKSNVQARLKKLQSNDL